MGKHRKVEMTSEMTEMLRAMAEAGHLLPPTRRDPGRWSNFLTLPCLRSFEYYDI
jgi:hypothetical protein